jgi:hypothetical protein
MCQIDVIAAPGSFEMRCNMTVTGMFRPVNALTFRAPKQGVRHNARVGSQMDAVHDLAPATSIHEHS